MLMAAEAHAFSITRTSSDVFYLSNNASNNIASMYVAYRVQNTTPSLEPDVWVKLDTFVGGSVALATYEDGLYHLRAMAPGDTRDRKSTRLNSSHSQISYAVFCLK